jgi:acyl-CoA:acyl-CoA alkyltransferase
MKVKISAVTAYVPENKVTSTEVEDRINKKQMWVTPGSLEKLFGVKTRFYANAEEQCSTLAAEAGKKILKNINGKEIDCLIYASACGDLIEPATANIVQQKLGLNCPSFDVKNACNSFLNGIHVANSFIRAGVHKKVLIVCGEILNHSIQFNISTRDELIKRLASFSLGDAGAAMLLEPSDHDSGIIFQDFQTFGQYWDLCIVPGGGSMHPHDASKNYFEGKTSELSDVFRKARGPMFDLCFKQSGWNKDDIDHVFVHQVSTQSTEAIAAELELSRHKVYSSVENYGNTGASSIPLCMSLAIEEGRVKSGDKIIVVGLAAGISLSVLLIKW